MSATIPPDRPDPAPAATPSTPSVVPGDISEAFFRRAARLPDHAAESRALVRLTRLLTDHPESVPQHLADAILELCRADSAGISFLDPASGTDELRWDTIAGPLGSLSGNTVSRHDSPSGVALDRDAVVVFEDIGHDFPGLRAVEPPIHETLIVPWRASGDVVGTIWVVHHTPEGHFDPEDVRLLEGFSAIAAAGWQARVNRRDALSRTREFDNQVRAEERLRLVLDAAGMGIYFWDPVTDRTDADERLLAMIGLDPGDDFSLATALGAHVHPDDRERFGNAVNEMLDPAGIGHLSEEVRWLGTDRVERWIAVNGQAIFEGEGETRQVARVIGGILDITGRRRMEDALRASEQRLRHVVENARGYAIFVLDEAGLITDWFSGAEAVFGWTAAEAIGQPAAITFTAGDVAAGVPERERRIAEANGVASNVRWHVHKDGREVIIDGVATALRDDDGSLRGFVMIGHDVTERRRAEQALRESEERFRTLVENLPDYAIFLMDPDGIITDWTDGAERVKGYTAEEAIGQSFGMFSTPEDRAAGRVEQTLAQAASTGRAEREGWRVRRGGERFWANEIVTSIRDGEGRLTGFTKISRDLTGRQLAEDALRESEERYRSLFSSIDQGFCVIEMLFDDTGHPVDYLFLEVNPAFARSTGLIDAVGKRMREFVPNHEEAWFEAYGRVALTGEPLRFEQEAAALGRWYSLYAFRVGAPEQHRVAVLFEDITARTLAEQEREHSLVVALRAVVARDRFLSIGAHELRTPVTSLKGTAQLLLRGIQRGTLDPARLERYGATLVESSQRLEELVNDLFDVARLHASEIGGPEEPQQVVDMAELVRATIDRHWRGRALQRIVTDLEKGPDIPVDPHRIQQVVVNLIENAVKYSPGGEPVTVRLRFDDNGAVIRVEDRGIGLPSGSEESIFQPFNRASNAAASKIPGLGLGLYICREIVEAYGGQLIAASAGEGQGTIMTLNLPFQLPTPGTPGDERRA